MPLYRFNSDDSEYIGIIPEQANPVNPSNRIIPENCTEVAPPAAGADQVATFTSTSVEDMLHIGAWTLEPDFRGQDIWHKTSKEQSTVEDIGAIASTHTLLEPTHEHHVWNETNSAWEIDTADQLAAYKIENKEAIRSGCKTAINASFSSSALGSAHTYPAWEDHTANRHDQSNIRNAYAALQAGAASEAIDCHDGTENSFRSHTEAQAAIVVKAMQTHIRVKREYLMTKVNAIDGAADMAAIDVIVSGITWP